MSLDRTSPVPAYYQILIDLKHRISAYEWKIGDAFPSESELMQNYDVSRVTIRQAMERLRQEKLVVSKRGQGSFLLSIPKALKHDLSFPSTFKEHLFQSGIELTAEVIDMKLISPAPEHIAKRLEISENQAVFFVQRIYSSENLPYSLNSAWIPMDLVPGIEERGLIQNSLATTLSEYYGLAPYRSENWLEAADAGKFESKHLYISPGTTLFVLHTLQVTEDKKIFEFSTTYWNKDRVQFHFSKMH